MDKDQAAQDYLVVCGSGLAKTDEGWAMAYGTPGRIKTAVDYVLEHPVAGMFLLGGHSKYGPAPPDGTKEAGLMRVYAERRLFRGGAMPVETFQSLGKRTLGIVTDEDEPSSGDTIDNAINLAKLIGEYEVSLGQNNRLLVVSGSGHYPRIKMLGGLALGWDKVMTDQTFDHLYVTGEDSLNGRIREGVGRQLVNILTSDIDTRMTEAQRLKQLRWVQTTLDRWMANKTSRTTLREIGQVAGYHMMNIWNSAPSTNFPELY